MPYLPTSFFMISLSKAKLAFFRSLLEKKYRHAEGMFLVEGIKMFQEAYYSTFEIVAVVVLQEQREKIQSIFPIDITFPIFCAENATFKQMATLNSPEGIITVIRFPKNDYFGKILTEVPADFLSNGHSFLLENIQDPGNVGTILRIADWFGIKQVICTEGTADVLNPKTLRSSMGAIFRVKTAYLKSLSPTFFAHSPQLYAADMQGTAIQSTPFSPNACIVLGNEANGVSAEILASAQAFTIPKIGGAESLNVGVAAGIIAYQLQNQ